MRNGQCIFYLLNICRLEMIHLQILFEILHPSLSEGRSGEGVAEWVDCRVDIHETIGVIPQGPGNNLDTKNEIIIVCPLIRIYKP